MNKDSDITRDILLRLLFEPVQQVDPPSGDIRRPVGSAEGVQDYSGAVNRSPEEPDLSGPDSSTVTDPEHLISYDDLYPVIDSGEETVVQTHFEALLKRRLRQEIEPRPPLFPWEKTLQDYPDALSNETGVNTLWLDHLRNLEVPTTLPEDVLAELFNQCQRVASHTQQAGRRLVEAVEALFPAQSQTLENIAGLVARPAYRSSQAQTLNRLDYETASSQQQIALSMLTAQSIFEALTLEVSATTPSTQKQWLTAAGTLTVAATYRASSPAQLEVKADLPEAGALCLTVGDEIIETHRNGPGELVVHLNAPSGNQACPLDISLGDGTTCPIQFQVLVESP